MPKDGHWSCASEWDYGLSPLPSSLPLPPLLPVLCHSDGMSRTGVFITTMAEVERVKVQGEVDIFQTVKAARYERPHMVSTPVSRGVPEVGCGWDGEGGGQYLIANEDSDNSVL